MRFGVRPRSPNFSVEHEICEDAFWFDVTDVIRSGLLEASTLNSRIKGGSRFHPQGLDMFALLQHLAHSAHAMPRESRTRAEHACRLHFARWSAGASKPGRIVSEAPQGNERGAMGSKNLPCILEPLFCSIKHYRSVLRPLSPYGVASLGVAQIDCRLQSTSQ